MLIDTDSIVDFLTQFHKKDGSMNNIGGNIPAITNPAQQVFQGRFGYYPCNYETYRKIRAIYSHYWQALHSYGRWTRWNRKEPQNRVSYSRVRNDKGQVVGKVLVGPVSEPQRSNVFYTVRGFRRKCEHALIDNGISECYNMARMPVENKNDVQNLPLSIAVINEMYDKLNVKAPA